MQKIKIRPLKIQKADVLFAIFALIVAIVSGKLFFQAGFDAAESVTPACQTEDSNGCFWDAEKSGNGLGVSFYADEDGNVYYMNTETEESSK